jgi:DNA-binding transcriptional LysR family regulator
LFNEAISDGRLLRVLADEDPSVVPIQILYVANRLLSRRAVVFMDFISDLFAAIPALNPDTGPNMATA